MSEDRVKEVKSVKKEIKRRRRIPKPGEDRDTLYVKCSRGESLKDGIILTANTSRSMPIINGGKMTINTGYAFELPHGTHALIYPCKELGRQGILLSNTIQVLGFDDTDELVIELWNRSGEVLIINPDTVIANIMFLKLADVDIKEKHWDGTQIKKASEHKKAPES